MIYSMLLLAGLCIPSFLLSMQEEGREESSRVVGEFPYEVPDNVLLHLNKAIELHEKTEDSYSMPSDARVLAAYLIAHRKMDLSSDTSVEEGLVYAVDEGNFRLATQALAQIHFDKALELLRKDKSPDAYCLRAELEQYEWSSLLHSRLKKRFSGGLYL
jgi:hypothetical protein